MEKNDLTKAELIEILGYMQDGMTYDDAVQKIMPEDMKNLVCMVHILFCNDKPCKFEIEAAQVNPWQEPQHIWWTDHTKGLLEMCSCDTNTMYKAVQEVLKISKLSHETLFAIERLITQYITTDNPAD